MRAARFALRTILIAALGCALGASATSLANGSSENEYLAREKLLSQSVTLIADARWDDAIGLVEPWLLSHPDDPLALDHYAKILKRSGRYPEATVALNHLIKIMPGSAQALSSLCWNQLLERRPDAALESCQKARLSAPSNFAILINLAHTHLFLGHREEARRVYGEALSQLQNDEDFQHYLLDDFELFILRGYQTEISRDMRKWVVDQWHGLTLTSRREALNQLKTRLMNALSRLDESSSKANCAEFEKLVTDLVQHADDPKIGIANILDGAAAACEEQQNYPVALTLRSLVLEISERFYGYQHPDVAIALNQKSEVLVDMGRYQEALPLQVRALSITEATLGHLHPAVAGRLNNLADLYQSMGRYHEALPAIQEALAIWERTLGPEHSYVATATNSYGGILAELGRYSEALPLQQRALAITEKIRDANHPDIANRLNNLAMTYRALGRQSEALPLVQRALAILEAADGPERTLFAAALNNKAQLLKDLGRYGEALPLEQRALAITEKIHGTEHPDVATRLNNLAGTYYALGQHEQVLRYLQRALAIWEKTFGQGHPLVTIAENNLGVIFGRLGRNDEALNMLQESLNRTEKLFGPDHPETALCANNLAIQYRTMNRSVEAKQLLMRAVNISRKMSGESNPALGRYLSNLAWIYFDEGEFGLAREAFEESVALLETNPGEAKYLAFAESGLRETFARQGHSEMAILWGKLSVNTLQQARIGTQGLEKYLQTGFIEGLRIAYDRLAELLIDQGRISEAQQVMQMLKENELYEAIERGGRNDSRSSRIAFTGLEENRFAGYYAMLDEQAALVEERRALWGKKATSTISSKELVRLDQIESVLLPRITEAIKAFFGSRKSELTRPKIGSSVEQINASGSQSRLAKSIDNLARIAPDSHTVAVQYLVGDTKLSIIVTSPGHPPIARQIAVERKRLRQLATQLGIQISERKSDLAMVNKTATDLYALLITPITQDLQTLHAKTLMLSLHDVLRYIPFAALTDGNRYLIQDYSLAIYNEAVGLGFNSVPHGRWRIAAMGLSEAVDGLPPLAEVPAELQEVSSTGKGVSFLNAAFNQSSFRSTLVGRFNLLHVASHFVLQQGEPKGSRLYLGDKSRLTLADIDDLDLRFDNFDLVTFSACDTALGGGKDVNGQELESLGAKTQAQGAHAVLASLWRVNDVSTRQLMSAFYKLRIVRGMNKAEALRTVQLEMIDGRLRPDKKAVWNSPYYWAPFVLMGNWL